MQHLGVEVSSIQGSVEDLSSRCHELLEGASCQEKEIKGRLLGLRKKARSLRGQVEEQQEEFEDALWRWQELQGHVDTCMQNLAVIEKSLEFQEKGEHFYEEQRRTYLVRKQ